MKGVLFPNDVETLSLYDAAKGNTTIPTKGPKAIIIPMTVLLSVNNERNRGIMTPIKVKVAPIPIDDEPMRINLPLDNFLIFYFSIKSLLSLSKEY